MINVNVDSEIGRLRKVILCYANPFVLNLEEIKTMLQPSVFLQMFKNRFSPYDFRKIREEQQNLIDLFKAHGVEVLMVDSVGNSSSQHYTRDVGFAIDDLFIYAKMATRIRMKEQVVIKKYTAQFSKVNTINKGKIEGGDVMLYENKVLVGLGEATNFEGINNLKETLAANNNSREIIPIQFNQRGVIHLDTKFNIVGNNLAIISPSCFEKKSLKWLENHFELIEASVLETKEILINTVSISPTKIIMKQGSDRLGNMLSDKGITPIFVKYNEVTKLPGSLRCTTCPIERESYRS